MPMNDHDRLINALRRARAANGLPSPDSREDNLRRLLHASITAAEVPDALRERVRILARLPEPCPPRSPLIRFWRSRSTRWVLSSALLAALVTLSVNLRPTWVAAQALRRIQGAMAGAHSADEVTWRVQPDGRLSKESEIWYQDGKWRLELQNPPRIQVYENGRLWSYQPEQNSVEVWRTTSPFGYRPSGFTLAAMTLDSRWSGWRGLLSVGRTSRVHGRWMYEVTLQSDGGHERALALVDRATDLPVRWTAQRQVGGRWVTARGGENHYNEPLSQRLFSPAFPKTARVIDRDADRRLWAERLQGEVARGCLGDRTIIIRDFTVCSEGDVFLLYTAGRRPGDAGPDWQVSLTNELGASYPPGGPFQPYMAGNPRLPGAGFTFNGAVLEGCWWVLPSTHGRRWPRRFIVRFHSGPRLPGEGIQSSAEFPLTISRPTASPLPGYMPYMALGADEWALHQRHQFVRER